MKLFEIIKENSKPINEGVFTNLIKKSVGAGFDNVLASSIETSLKKVLDDILKGGKQVTMSAFRNSSTYKETLVDTISKSAMIKYQMPFENLPKAQGELLAKEVQKAIDGHLIHETNKLKKLADADVAVSQLTRDQASLGLKANTATKDQLIAATKNLAVNQKLQTRVDIMKKVLSEKNQFTRTQINNMLKKNAKIIEDTGEKISQQVAGETTIFSGGRLLKISKDQLKSFPGIVKRVIVNNPVKSALIVAGLGIAALYLIYGDGTILTDEGGKAVDDDGSINEYAPCVQELIKNGEGKIDTVNGQVGVEVFPSEYPEGIKFFPNGRVFEYATKKKGSWKCKEGQITIQEQNDSIPGPELMPYAYQYVRDNNTTSQDTPQQSAVNSSKVGLKNIEITWDSPGGNRLTSIYHDCNSKSLPHEFGCRSEQIKQVQICLNFPEKYKTGNFGPITKKALEDKGIDTSNGLTQSIVDSVCQSGDEATDRNREPIQPITADRLKMSDLVTPQVDIKLPNIKPLEVTPAQFYNALRDNNNIVGEDGNNRIKYKGPDLDDTQLGRLDSALSDMGYTRIKQLEDVKRYGSKYVWLKQ